MGGVQLNTGLPEKNMYVCTPHAGLCRLEWWRWRADFVCLRVVLRTKLVGTYCAGRIETAAPAGPVTVTELNEVLQPWLLLIFVSPSSEDVVSARRLGVYRRASWRTGCFAVRRSGGRWGDLSVLGSCRPRRRSSQNAGRRRILDRTRGASCSGSIAGRSRQRLQMQLRSSCSRYFCQSSSCKPSVCQQMDAERTAKTNWSTSASLGMCTSRCVSRGRVS